LRGFGLRLLPEQSVILRPLRELIRERYSI
jgi:hypothetical protein